MYLAFAASAFQTKLAYRGQVWAQIFGKLVRAFARVAIWMSIYGGASAVGLSRDGAIDGISLQEMITYAVIGGSMVALWEWQRHLYTIGDQIKGGDVVVFLIKPLRYPLMLFANECGNMAVRILTVMLPTVVIMGLVFGLLPPASLAHGALFFAFWILSFVMMFMVATVFGFVAFWMMTSFSLEWFLEGLMSIFSGIFIPLWFFPEAAAAVIKHLPFAWVGFHPMAVYLGKMDIEEALATFAEGIGWVLVLMVIVALLWRAASSRIIVQGG